MKRSIAILSLIFLLSSLSISTWCGEGRYVIEDETVASTNNLSDSEQCKKAYYAEEYADAFPACLRAAGQGDADTQYYLGDMYHDGLGVKQDYTKAAAWYLKSSEQGDSYAQYSLGTMFEEGEGVKQDYSKAVFWFQKAANQGNKFAQCDLGTMYSRGLGVYQDNSEAVTWYRKAADQGFARAQYNIGNMYCNGQGVKKDFSEATVWFRKAADQGHAKAQYNIGATYDGGSLLECGMWFNDKFYHDFGRRLDIAPDYAEAMSWYKKSANQGFSLAQVRLGQLYYFGNGVPKNYSEAAKWYLKAAEQGNSHGQNLLGELFKNGQGVSKDLVKALAWYTLASASNDYVAKYRDEVEKKLSPAQIQQAQQLATNYQLKIEQGIIFSPYPSPSGQANVSNDPDINSVDAKEVFFGTGWPIQSGYVVTNQHVVNGKKHIVVMLSTGEKISASVLMEDKINDLALLQVNQPGKLPPALPVAKSSAKTGSKVFTIGYPHPDIMGAKPKLTEGIVNAVSGYMDDPRTLQISVPVQAGNSGGPLLNMNGEVVGIVTAKLSAVKMFNWTGDLPQNVNYAVKAPYLTALLNSESNQSIRVKSLPIKQGNLETLSLRIQKSILMIISE